GAGAPAAERALGRGGPTGRGRFDGPPLLADAEAKVVAWSPDGEIVASGGGRDAPSGKPAILLWSASTGRVVGRLTDAAADASSLAFSADGKTLVSMNVTQIILVWDVATRTLARRIERQGDSFHA